MATSSREEVLRLKRTDHKTAHLVLHVADHSTSQDTLDLKLMGTDSDYLYHGNVKESTLKSLQASNFKGNLAEFKTVLSYALLRRRPDGAFPDVLEGVETVAAISGKAFTVTIRKNISRITQKLAAISLEEDTEREGVNFIEWTDAVLSDRDDLQGQLAEAQGKAKEQQAQLATLSAELNKLVKAKKQHEEEMLSKFAALLNAKKLKIRDQQRLLSSAKIDVDAAEEVEQARSSSAKSSRRAGASGKGKRKANGTAEPSRLEVEDEGEDEDDATAAGTDDTQEEDRRRQETPETDEEDLADEDVEVEANGNGIANAIDDSQTTRRVATKQVQHNQRSQRSSQKMDVDKQKSPSPPARKLPSRKAKSPAKEPTPQPQSNDVNDEDDDETDDEL